MAGLLSFVPVLAPIFLPIALAAGGAALLMNAALAAAGHRSWKSFAVDAGLMALPGAGRLVSRGRQVGVPAGTRMLDDVPLTFRGDARPPEIIFKEGFQPWGGTDDLFAYAKDNVHSNFVGTSRSSVVAVDMAQPGGYHYVIQKPGGIDVNAALGSRSPYPDELEVVFRGGIEPNYVVGVNKVRRSGRLGRFIANPDFQPSAP